MRIIKFRYIFRHLATGNIEIKKYSLNQLEETLTKFLSPVFDFREYELLARNQFIGLKDKNGAEIYEGDIVYVGLDEPPMIIKYECEKGRFIFEDRHYEMEWKIDDLHFDDLVIVGNIHVNPELLNA